MQIEVVGALDIKEGVSKRTGNPYRIASQAAYVHRTGQAYPEKTTINVNEADHPKGYATGIYELDVDKSISVGQYGIEFRDMVLGKKISESKAAA